MPQPDPSELGPPVSQPADDFTDGRSRASQADQSAGETSLEGIENTPPRTSQLDKSTATRTAAESMPERIGGFRLMRTLGRGTFGSVFLGEDSSGQKAAIKVAVASKVRATLQYGDVRGSLRNEALAVQDLDHPGIVKLLSFDLPEGRPQDWYLAYAYISGGTLQDRLKTGALPVGTAVSIAIRLAEALHYAHSRNRIHRDIKPANILLDEHDQPYLSDFGLAVTDREMLRLSTGREGTPLYFAPEQIEGEPHLVNYRADLYALGAVLYAMLAGQPPFADYTDREQLFRLIADTAPKGLRNFNPRIPKELDRICQLALRKRQEDRYQDALSLAEDLKEVQQLLSGQSIAPGQNFVPSAPPPMSSVGHSDLGASGSGSSSGTNMPSASGSAVSNGTGSSGGGATGTSTALLTASGPGSLSNSASASEPAPIAIVPKGLRSFDQDDADYFLSLLPGPWDKSGVPMSVAYWVTAITRPERERAFRVGLIYGPSGCGKSSLVKAGLLPRLGDAVLAIYLEATPDHTEAQIRQLIRAACPGAWEPMLATLGEAVDEDPSDEKETPPLNEFLKVVRRDPTLRRGRKLLIVIDQFEQWLHAHREEMRTTELVRALRQADGEQVQFLLMVRDDFWLPTSRLFHDLEVKLIEGQSQRLVDLFDMQHARQVLLSYGVAYRRLPNPLEHPLTADQEKFLDEAIRGLAQDRRIICVRLSLFADMLRDREWSTQTLREVGGIEGLGVVFLEETFGAHSRHPELRHFGQAVRALLSELLPGIGTDIKGSRRTREQLAIAARLSNSPEQFERLIEILDRELRIITPVAEENAYELAHDYIVPSLREWLTKKQRESRRGRAELLLAERAAQWAIKPENRFLPSVSEWLRFRWYTDKSRWTEPQRAMMARAAKVLPRDLGMLSGFLLILAGGFLLFLTQKEERERLEQAEKSALRTFDSSSSSNVFSAIQNLEPHKERIIPQLRKKLTNPRLTAQQRAHAGFALVKLGDANSREDVLDATLKFVPEAVPEDGRNILHTLQELSVLTPQKADTARHAILAQLVAEGRQYQRRAVNDSVNVLVNQARYALLALYLGDSSLAAQMLAESRDPSPRASLTVVASKWPGQGDVSALHAAQQAAEDESVRSGLISLLGVIPLKTIADSETYITELMKLHEQTPSPAIRSAVHYTLTMWGQKLPPTPRTSPIEPGRRWIVNSAGMTLLRLNAGDYAFSQPLPEGQVRKPVPQKEKYEPLLAAAIESLKVEPNNSRALLDRATALFHLGQYDEALSVFGDLAKDYPDFTPSYQYRALAYARQQNSRLARQQLQLFLDKELTDHSTKAYLRVVVAHLLGEPKSELEELAQSLQTQASNPSWLYDGACAYSVLSGLSRDPDQAAKHRARALELLAQAIRFGYRNFQHMAEDADLVPLHDSSEFLKLLQTEPVAKVARALFIGDREVSVQQFQQFLDDKSVAASDRPVDWLGHDEQVSRSLLAPMQRVSWIDSVLFCNWLSRREGLQAVYERKAQPSADGALSDWNCHLDRNGYRLPTDAEWEVACRAAATTNWNSGRFGGDTHWYSTLQLNTRPYAFSGGSRLPNQWGWFDMQGNVAEWCQSAPAGESLAVARSQAARGGSWNDLPENAWPSSFSHHPIEHRANTIGFRIVRAAE